jgi:hypothetical protein
MHRQSVILRVGWIMFPPLSPPSPLGHCFSSDLWNRLAQIALHLGSFPVLSRATHRIECGFLHHHGTSFELSELAGIKLSQIMGHGLPDCHSDFDEVDAKSINFHRPNSFLKDFRYGYGTTLKKGVVYFGFCQWVMFRGNWIVFGTVGTARDTSTQIHISNPEWNRWPIRVTVKTP